MLTTIKMPRTRGVGYSSGRKKTSTKQGISSHGASQSQRMVLDRQGTGIKRDAIEAGVTSRGNKGKTQSAVDWRREFGGVNQIPEEYRAPTEGAPAAYDATYTQTRPAVGTPERPRTAYEAADTGYTRPVVVPATNTAGAETTGVANSVRETSPRNFWSGDDVARDEVKSYLGQGINAVANGLVPLPLSLATGMSPKEITNKLGKGYSKPLADAISTGVDAVGDLPGKFKDFSTGLVKSIGAGIDTAQEGVRNAIGLGDSDAPVFKSVSAEMQERGIATDFLSEGITQEQADGLYKILPQSAKEIISRIGWPAFMRELRKNLTGGGGPSGQSIQEEVDQPSAYDRMMELRQKPYDPDSVFLGY